MKKIFGLVVIVIATFILVSCGRSSSATSDIPEASNSLVNDYANILSENEISELETSLVQLDEMTGAQILVLIVLDLNGYEIADYAQRVGQKWGVGDKSNKGLVMVIKPKNETKGQAFIATGYGLEGCLPDIRCKQVVSDIMVPNFKQNDYYGAISDALEFIIPIIIKESSN